MGRVNPLAHVLTQLAYAVRLKLHGDMNFWASCRSRRTFLLRSGTLWIGERLLFGTAK